MEKKNLTKTINLKYKLQHRKKNITYTLKIITISYIQEYFKYIIKNMKQ